ncbi:hypothetical protein D3C81_2010870 [compost metagenome]
MLTFWYDQICSPFSRYCTLLGRPKMRSTSLVVVTPGLIMATFDWSVIALLAPVVVQPARAADIASATAKMDFFTNSSPAYVCLFIIVQTARLPHH